jgi:hypothetical protein
VPWMPPPKERKKRIHPIWGGVGLILIPIYVIGSYYGAMYVVAQNRALGWFYVPESISSQQQTIFMAAVIGFGTFAIISIIWAILRGPMGGPTDIHYSKMRRIKKRY